jgi:protein-disulfide isomerase
MAKKSKSRAGQQPPSPAAPEEAKRTTSQMSSAAKTKERIEERKREVRRNRQRVLAIGLVVFAVLAGLLILARTQPTDAPVDAANSETYAGIAQSVNDDGFPRLGNPDAATNIVEYASFGCPGCASFHQTVFPQILPYLASGQASFTFIPQVQIGEGNVEGAAKAALCAGTQDKFWEMHDVLFDWQARFGANAFSDSRIRAGIQGLGLNLDINACFNSEPINNLIGLARQQAVTSTPTVLVDGVALTNPLSFDEIGAALGPVNPVVETPVETQEADVTAEPTADVTQESAATEEADETAEADATAEATEAGD